MKKRILTISLFGGIFIATSAFIVKDSNGKAGQTGSPGESTCSACHSGGSSALSGMTITAIPSFTNNEYVQGQTYTMSIIVGAVGFNNFGFGCEILKGGNTNAGTMQNAGTGVKFLNAFNGRKNATHTTPKNGTGLATFTFEWTAPATQETVNVFAVGNCVNLNGGTSGDLPLQASLTLTTPAVTGLEKNKGDVSSFSFYPNPVMETVNFSYNLSQSGDVIIELIGINGQLISQLVNEKQAAGLHNLSARISPDVPAGVYFLKTSLNNKAINQKLITVN